MLSKRNVFIFCGLVALASGGGEIVGHELKVASVADQSVLLLVDGKIPNVGLKGNAEVSVGYSNDVLCVGYDFTRGGTNLSLGLGSFAAGTSRIKGDFRCVGASDCRLGIRLRDRKGDCFVGEDEFSPIGGWTHCAFDLARVKPEGGAGDKNKGRVSVEWPVTVELAFVPHGARELCKGTLEVRKPCLVQTDGTYPDCHFKMKPLPYGALYYPGETLRTSYRLMNLRTDGKASRMHLSRAVVTDWRDAEVCVRTLKDCGDLELTEEDVGRRFGGFQVAVWGVSDDGAECELKRFRFARLTSREVRPCPWVGTGTHGSHGWGYGDFRHVDLLAAAGIGIVRGEPNWAASELKKGEYAVPANFETYVDRLNARGIKMNMTIGYGNPIYDNPLDAKAYAKFCGWIADHFRGRVDWFEIWNEPHNFQFASHYRGRKGGRPIWMSKFIELTHAADDAIRAVRPDATVAVTSQSVEPYLDRMLKWDIARAHNAVSFHPYCHDQHRPERKFFLNDFGAKHRALAKAHGGADRWCVTESGWTTYEGKGAYWTVAGQYPRASMSGQADCIVRMYLAAKESGCAFACQYDFKDDGPCRSYTEHNFGLMTMDFEPKPSFAAVAFLTRLLGAAEFVRELSPDPNKFRIAAFRRNGSPAYALWAVEGTTEIEIPKDVRGGICHDLMGNARPLGTAEKLTLTESPVYLVR